MVNIISTASELMLEDTDNTCETDQLKNYPMKNGIDHNRKSGESPWRLYPVWQTAII